MTIILEALRHLYDSALPYYPPITLNTKVTYIGINMPVNPPPQFVKYVSLSGMEYYVSKEYDDVVIKHRGRMVANTATWRWQTIIIGRKGYLHGDAEAVCELDRDDFDSAWSRPRRLFWSQQMLDDWFQKFKDLHHHDAVLIDKIPPEMSRRLATLRATVEQYEAGRIRP